jgi:HPt (histidine-containing phosphotransfer) domain-containing protein
MDGDEAALRRLVGIFLETTPALLANMRTASERRDAPALLLATHTLHGSLTHLEETESRKLAAELERAARAGHLERAVSMVADLDRRLSAFQTSLRQWLEGGGAV